MDGAIHCIIGRFQSMDAVDYAGETIVQAVANATKEERFSRSSQYGMMEQTKSVLQKKINNKRVYNNKGGTWKKSKRKASKQQPKCGDTNASRQEEEEERKSNIMERRKLILQEIADAKQRLLVATAALRDIDDILGSGAVSRNPVALESLSSIGVSGQQSPHTTDEESTDSDSSSATYSHTAMITSHQQQQHQQQQQQCSRVKLFFVLDDQNAGCIEIDSKTVLTYDDISNAIVKEDDVSMNGFMKCWYGDKVCWVPNRVMLTGRNKFSRLSAMANMVKRFESFFKSSRCILDQGVRNILAAGTALSFGGSDESAVMIMNATVKAIAAAMGLDISNEAISKEMPGRDSVKVDENYLASMIRIVKRQEMRDDDADEVGLQCDHGNRKGCDHFIQVFSWVGKDPSGHLRIKNHVISSNHSGGTAQESADGLLLAKKELCYFDDPGETVGIISATSDTGGGGAIQNSHPLMVQNGAMTSDSVRGNCLLHGGNKSFEWSCVRVFGGQGIGFRTLWQMLYVWRQLMKRAKSENNGKVLDEMYKCVVEKLRTEGNAWRREAGRI